MTRLEALQRIADAGGRLRAVTAHDFEGDPRFTSHIVLEFEASRLVLSTLQGDDSILLSDDLPSTSGCVPRVAPAWTPALGRAVLWSWLLTNHQGYVDGVRFDFRNTASDSPISSRS
jgi:Family of unknown function (DUF6334)